MIKYLFMYLLAIFGKKKSILFLCLFLNHFFFFCYWVIWVIYQYIFNINSLLLCGLEIFSPIMFIAFSLCWLFLLTCRRFLVWCYLTCLFFFLLLVLLVTFIKSLLRLMLKSFFIMLTFRGFMVSDLTFRYLIHCKLIFVIGIRWSFIILCINILSPNTIYWRYYIFSIEYSWHPCKILTPLAWIYSHNWGSLVVQMVKHLPTMLETWVRSPGWKEPLEKEMATHSSTLA